jgi:CRISPR/Cas system-associated exonuclease Cas4 (RecB family)
VFNRTRWSEKSTHDVGLELIFRLGNEFEDMVVRQLQDARVRVVEQQKSYDWKKYQVTGHIDGQILGEDGELYPFDIKSSSPFVFDSIHTIDDLKNGKYSYLRNYPVQLNLYLLMEERERGLFIFVNKVNGRLKEIWMDLDYALGEETLLKCEAINAHVAAGTVPEPIPYSEDICGRCPFKHVCLPERIGQEIEIVDDAELSAALDRFHELKPLSKEYDELGKFIGQTVNGKEKLMIGDYIITGKWVEKRESVTPASRYWRRKIDKII